MYSSHLHRQLTVVGSLVFTWLSLQAFTGHGQEPGTEPPPRPEDVVVPEGLDHVARLQHVAIKALTADWGYWGFRPQSYSSWTNHSNRLIPLYVFGATLEKYVGANSIYRDPARLESRFGYLPSSSVNPEAQYCDQTDVYHLQRDAIESQHKKYIFLVVFDGMDWQTTHAASIVKNQSVAYSSGKGTGFSFQDYDRCNHDFGYFANGPFGEEVETDVDAQLNKKEPVLRGGYDWRLGGSTPWSEPLDAEYLIGRNKNSPHAVTDSSSSASSMTAGVKILNGAINILPDYRHAETIAQWAQRERNFGVGAVTSVPIPHATPAASYAVNVSRDDYQDIARDMLGLPSVSRKHHPLPGLDVLIGAGFGEKSEKGTGQGNNFVPGNIYLTDADRDRVDIRLGGDEARYVVAQRTAGEIGSEVLARATDEAIHGNHRLLGFFGAINGHLPCRTANGDYHPVANIKGSENYSAADLYENPTLAQMTESAIRVLEKKPQGFWLMVESGDVDWANHANNIDSSIGAVFSGDDAIRVIFHWIESQQVWDQSLVIVTADHGHYFHLTRPEVLITPAETLAGPASDHSTSNGE